MSSAERLATLERKLAQMEQALDSQLRNPSSIPHSKTRLARAVEGAVASYPTTGNTFYIQFLDGTYTRTVNAPDSGSFANRRVNANAICYNLAGTIPTENALLHVFEWGGYWWTYWAEGEASPPGGDSDLPIIGFNDDDSTPPLTWDYETSPPSTPTIIPFDVTDIVGNSHANVSFTSNESTIDFTVSTSTETATTLTAHGFQDGDAVKLTSTGTLPGGLVELMFVRDATTTTFKLALTSGGAAVDITTAESGETHSAALDKENSFLLLPGKYLFEYSITGQLGASSPGALVEEPELNTMTAILMPELTAGGWSNGVNSSSLDVLVWARGGEGANQATRCSGSRQYLAVIDSGTWPTGQRWRLGFKGEKDSPDGRSGVHIKMNRASWFVTVVEE